MAIPITKKVARCSETVIRDAGRYRRLIVTLYPHDVLGLRPEKTRREELIPLDAIYSAAVKMRVAAEQRAKREKKKAS